MLLVYCPQTQATIEALTGATNGAPRHPLRLALGDNFRTMANVEKDMCNSSYKEVQQALTHFCKMRMFAPPEFLLRFVAGGVKHKMPAGIIVHRVNFRMGTLAGMETGTEMVEMSFSDLALRIMGQTISHTYRIQIRDLFARAEVVSSDEILSKIENVYEEIMVSSITEQNAKSAILRLKERLAMLLSEKLPDCPVSLQPIPKERVRILGCCTCVIDSESLACCSGRCPLCRAPIKSVGAAGLEEPAPPQEEAPVVSKAAGKRPASSQPAVEESDAKRSKATHKPVSAFGDDSDSDDPPQEEAPVVSKAAGKRPASSQPAVEQSDGKRPKATHKPVSAFGDDSDSDSDSDDEAGEPRVLLAGGLIPSDPRTIAFHAKLDEITRAQHYTINGVIMILRAQLELNHSSRMLLCFGFDSSQQEEAARIFTRIRSEFPEANVTEIDRCVRNPNAMDSAKAKFDDPLKFPEPQLFVINTVESSSSVQGLDLHATDLTLVAAKCSQATQRQAIGRSLRMKNRPLEMSEKDRFPAKNVVVASIGTFA